MKTIKTVFNNLFNKRRNENLEIKDEEKIGEDYVTTCMGSFGLYQTFVCTIAGLSRFLGIWNVLSTVFITPKTDFFCKEYKDNVLVELKNSTCDNDCLKFVYHQQVFQSTLTSKFELICERAWLAGFAQTILILGVGIGSWIFGWIADRRGRRVGLRLAAFLNVIFMCVTAFSMNYWTFITIRFFVGVNTGGIFVISTVYVLEVVGSKHREIGVCWILVSDGIAEAVMTIFAYYSSTWDIFLLEYSAISVLIFFLILILPDSPRWYVSHGNVERAVEVITRAALWNKLDTGHIEENIKKYMEEVKIPSERVKTNHMHLFHKKEISTNTLCIIMICVQAGIGLYVINEYITLLLPNIYFSVIAFGLVQVPAAFLSIILNKIFRRRTLLMTAFIVNGLSMAILISLPNLNWMAIIFGVFSLSSIIIVFSVTYIFIAELNPTPLRCTAMGVGNSGAKIGALVTPFIITLKPVWVPVLILSVLLLIAFSICLLLQEIKGRHLKDTLPIE